MTNRKGKTTRAIGSGQKITRRRPSSLATLRMIMVLSFLCYQHCCIFTAPSAAAFVHPSFAHVGTMHTRKSITRINNSGRLQQAKGGTADFEYQELKVQLDAMTQQKVDSKQLDPLVRQQLCQYATAVATQRPSPVLHVGQNLPGSSWRLVLSNEPTTLSSLPRDASVYLEFAPKEEEEANNKKSLLYKLQFGEQTFGLNSIQAKSWWTYDDERRLLSFEYDTVSTDAFGMKNVGVGLFGLLQGRINYVQTAYFDHQYWIERNVDASTGNEYVNVYVRQD